QGLAPLAAPHVKRSASCMNHTVPAEVSAQVRIVVDVIKSHLEPVLLAICQWPLILTHPKVANRPEMQIGFPAFWQAGNRSDDEVERDTQNKIIT
ncbi:hypothetical protein, partial [Klebsiella pneumoniae]|uniref:hypothetical protein n=1 Tax=Klebsiella pneumoniae TaxID=573 RepID=UPI001A8DEB83